MSEIPTKKRPEDFDPEQFVEFHYGEKFERVDPKKPCWIGEMTGLQGAPASNRTHPQSDGKGRPDNGDSL